MFRDSWLQGFEVLHHGLRLVYSIMINSYSLSQRSVGTRWELNHVLRDLRAYHVVLYLGLSGCADDPPAPLTVTAARNDRGAALLLYFFDLYSFFFSTTASIKLLLSSFVAR